jgi:hypothetical protein
MLDVAFMVPSKLFSDGTSPTEMFGDGTDFYTRFCGKFEL